MSADSSTVRVGIISLLIAVAVLLIIMFVITLGVRQLVNDDRCRARVGGYSKWLGNDECAGPVTHERGLWEGFWP